MLGVISTGGKQYRVSERLGVRVESSPPRPGPTSRFDKVRRSGRASVKIGSPFLSGGKGSRPCRGTARATRCASSNSAAASTTCGRARTASNIRSEGHRKSSAEPAIVLCHEKRVMAQKKAGGSTKNGRESEIRSGSGSRNTAASTCWPATSLAASARHRLSGRRQRRHGHGLHLFAKATGRVQYRKKGVEQHTFVSVDTE